MDESQNSLVRYRVPPAGAPRPGEPAPPIPAELCRLCWRDQLVHLDGTWWLEHVGPLDRCLHDCHRSSFLDSTS